VESKNIIVYEGEEPFIFLSYSHKDMTAAKEIVGELCAAGYRCWYDKGIRPGSEYGRIIAHHIEKCSFFVALISGDYLTSEYCNDEIHYAQDLEKARVLVYLENVGLPSAMYMRNCRFQAIRKYEYINTKTSDFYSELLGIEGIKLCLAFSDKREEKRGDSQTSIDSKRPTDKVQNDSISDIGDIPEPDFTRGLSILFEDQEVAKQENTDGPDNQFFGWSWENLFD
jgi:WD-40 repeat protein